MADSIPQTEDSSAVCSLAKSLAPEDVRVGDYVSPLHETYDFPSYLWSCDEALEDRARTVAIRFVPEGCGAPLKVQAVCLPFVFVKHPVRGCYALDVRRHQLARLDRSYAKLAWAALKPKSRESKKRRKKR